METTPQQIATNLLTDCNYCDALAIAAHYGQKQHPLAISYLEAHDIIEDRQKQYGKRILAAHGVTITER